MVQAAPNESIVTGTVHGRRPDPQRPGFDIVDLRVERHERGMGEATVAPTSGDVVHVCVRESMARGLDEAADPAGAEMLVAATVSMVGPGVWMARSIELLDRGGLELTPDRGATGDAGGPAGGAGDAGGPADGDEATSGGETSVGGKATSGVEATAEGGPGPDEGGPGPDEGPQLAGPPGP